MTDGGGWQQRTMKACTMTIALLTQSKGPHVEEKEKRKEKTKLRKINKNFKNKRNCPEVW